MSEINTIKSYKPSNNILDFDYLKQKGIESIQRYSGKVWTDYNVHDPGITILEVLCFSLTEIGYRCKYSIQDLLGQNTNSGTEQTTADKILFTNPITKIDFRKLLLNLDEVRNVWVEPDQSILDYHGLWKVAVETLPDVDKEILLQKISSELYKSRNICEDFSSISFVDYEPVGFQLDIEIEENVEIVELTKTIYQSLESNLNPTCRYYGLEELIEKGYSADEIFLGPEPTNGFILEEDLQQLELKNKIFASDIYHLLMDIPGISYLKRFRIIDQKGKAHKWVHSVKEGKAAKLDIGQTEIKFYHLEKQIPQKAGKSFYDKEFYQAIVKSKHKTLKFEEQKLEFIDFGKYQSIQNDFPEIYGVGKTGVPINSGEERQAQAKQLKAYLMLFDQLNANFLSQLENLSNILSISTCKKTYHSNALLDIPDIEYLYTPFIQLCLQHGVDLKERETVKTFWNENKSKLHVTLEQTLNEIVETEHDVVKRRNRMLDHLLARFSFNFEEFSIDTEPDNEDIKRVIEKKQNILQNINSISTNRIQGQNIQQLEKNTVLDQGFNATLQHFLSFNHSDAHVGNTLSITSENNDDEAFKFLKVNPKQVPNLISQFGRERSNYRIVKQDNIYSLELMANDQTLAEHTSRFENEEAVVEKIDLLIKQIEEINKGGESIYYFEHILLRPPKDAQAFHFQFNDELGNPIFSSSEPQSREERSKVWKQILSFGQNRNNYKVKNIGNSQYKFAVLNNNKKEVATSNMFFHNEEDVQTMITSAINTLVKLNEGKVEEKNHLIESPEVIRPDYQFKDIYSNMVTYVLPGWHYRFQNEHARTWIENKLMELTPAHIFPNIKWMQYDEMIDAVSSYYEVLTLKSNADYDAAMVYEKQKALFQLII